jgi:hypothetical protein
MAIKKPLSFLIEEGGPKTEVKRKGSSEEDIGALKRALNGVKDPRHKAFIMLNAVPEERLPELVEYLKVLTG